MAIRSLADVSGTKLSRLNSLVMGAVGTFEMSVSFYQTTQGNITEKQSSFFTLTEVLCTGLDFSMCLQWQVTTVEQTFKHFSEEIQHLKKQLSSIQIFWGEISVKKNLSCHLSTLQETSKLKLCNHEETKRLSAENLSMEEPSSTDILSRLLSYELRNSDSDLQLFKTQEIKTFIECSYLKWTLNLLSLERLRGNENRQQKSELQPLKDHSHQSSRRREASFSFLVLI